MIIWGSKGKTKVVDRGYFLCPSCRTNQPYDLKVVGKYFTLYFIPLFQTSKLGEYVECQVCRTTYKTEILDASGEIEDQLNAELKLEELIGEISRQLDAGLPVQAVAKDLINAGLPEEAFTKILMTATNGQMSKCTNCGTNYKSTVLFCSICGSRLPAK